jgi:transcriptional regulator with XRE-family HTH domain
VYVGRRVAKLRAAHGESLREAAVRTGVSHTTIARIEKGEVTGSFHSTLRKIADGYGVRMEFLLTGRDPRQDFEFSIRRLPTEDRSKLYFVSPRTRTKMVLDFLVAEYGNEFSLQQIAEVAGIDGRTFQEVLHHWHPEEMSEETYLRIAEALSRMTGISPHWFHWGTLGQDNPESLPTEMISQYVNLMKKAAQHGINPDVLDMAIDLLIMRNKENQVQYRTN